MQGSRSAPMGRPGTSRPLVPRLCTHHAVTSSASLLLSPESWPAWRLCWVPTARPNLLLADAGAVADSALPPPGVQPAQRCLSHSSTSLGPGPHAILTTCSRLNSLPGHPGQLPIGPLRLCCPLTQVQSPWGRHRGPGAPASTSLSCARAAQHWRVRSPPYAGSGCSFSSFASEYCFQIPSVSAQCRRRACLSRA